MRRAGKIEQRVTEARGDARAGARRELRDARERQNLGIVVDAQLGWLAINCGRDVRLADAVAFREALQQAQDTSVGGIRNVRKKDRKVELGLLRYRRSPWRAGNRCARRRALQVAARVGTAEQGRSRCPLWRLELECIGAALDALDLPHDHFLRPAFRRDVNSSLDYSSEQAH